MAASKRTRFICCLCVAVLALMALCVGCAGSDYDLDRDKSLKTQWGTVLQFKVDSDWVKSDYPIDEDDSSYMAFYSEDGNVGVSISVENTAGSLYEYSSTSTYGDWIDSFEEFYTKTPEEQAEEYVSLFGDSEYYDPEEANPEYYDEYRDFSLDELNQVEIDGETFRVFKVKVTVVLSESRYEEAKKEDPDTEREWLSEAYYAILKEDGHDVEIYATSEELLRDFAGTMTIDW